MCKYGPRSSDFSREVGHLYGKSDVLMLMHLKMEINKPHVIWAHMTSLEGETSALPLCIWLPPERAQNWCPWCLHSRLPIPLPQDPTWSQVQPLSFLTLCQFLSSDSVLLLGGGGGFGNDVVAGKLSFLSFPLLFFLSFFLKKIYLMYECSIHMYLMHWISW